MSGKMARSTAHHSTYYASLGFCKATSPYHFLVAMEAEASDQ
jgi:hypothetical protein